MAYYFLLLHFPNKLSLTLTHSCCHAYPSQQQQQKQQQQQEEEDLL